MALTTTSVPAGDDDSRPRRGPDEPPMIAVYLPAGDPVQAAQYHSQKHLAAMAIWIRHLHGRGLDPAIAFDTNQLDGELIGRVHHPGRDPIEVHCGDYVVYDGHILTVMGSADFISRYKPLVTVAD